MTLGRRDAVATALTALVVLTFFATRGGWNVAYVGDSHRWAAGVITALGVVTCALGRPTPGPATRILAVLGVFALGLSVFAVWTGSLTSLALFVVDIVLLWGASTLVHIMQDEAKHDSRRPIVT